MRRLLRDGGGEFPAEYLVSRLRGRRRKRLERRHALQGGMDGGVWPSEEAIEEERDREIHWLYRQLNHPTAKALGPLFLLLELRRFVNWLRQREGGGGLGDDGFYPLSLFADPLRRELKEQHTAAEALLSLEKRVVPVLPAMRGISRAYGQKGLLAVEQQMTAALLALGATRGRATPMGDLCRRLIDFGNLMRLVKAWLWKLSPLPAFMPAGHLSPMRLQRIDREGDVVRIGLPASVSRETITPEQIAALEERHKKTIWRAAQVQARQLEPLAVIIEYLCFIEAETVFLRGRRPGGGG